MMSTNMVTLSIIYRKAASSRTFFFPSEDFQRCVGGVDLVNFKSSAVQTLTQTLITELGLLVSKKLDKIKAVLSIVLHQDCQGLA